MLVVSLIVSGGTRSNVLCVGQPSHPKDAARCGDIGRHFFLNQWPELQGTDNYINSVNHEDMAESTTMCLFRQTIPIAKMMTCTIYAMK